MRYYVDLRSLDYGKDHIFGDLMRARGAELCGSEGCHSSKG